MLRLEGISKSYGGRAVLREISLDIPARSVTLVAGPNGAGKSTLLHVMAGFSRPDVGTLACDAPPGRIGYLGHSTLVYPNLTALENLAFWCRLHGENASEERLLDALAHMGLDAFADEAAGTFSRGMAQRLSLARMLLLRPSLALLDEPLTGLDTASAAAMRRAFAGLAAAGVAVVWVSHDIASDAPYADTVVELARDGAFRVVPAATLRAQAEDAVTVADEKTPDSVRDFTPITSESRNKNCEPREGAAPVGLLEGALAVAGKDLRLVAARGSTFAQAVLLGLLLIVLFSLSLEGKSTAEGHVAAAMFWLASAFAQVLVFNALFALEETGRARLGLLLAPVPPQAVWLGKAVAGLCLLGLVQFALGLATVIFLGQSWMVSPLLALGGVLLADIGVAGLGALLGALAQGQATRESLCGIVLFPLLIPVFLAGIQIIGTLFAAGGSGIVPETASITGWLGLAAAFDAVFLAAALLLFPFLYGGEG